MNTSVTKALREVLLDLFAYKHLKQVYSDPRKDGVGVKFVGLNLTDDQMDQVRHRMEARGFTHHYSRTNAQGHTYGTRFCYSPPGVEIVKKPKQSKKTEQSVVSLGIETKTNKNMSTPKMYEVHLRDIMKIHDIACDMWKEMIMNNYISNVHKLKLTYTFFQSDVDRMFLAATRSQVPVLEQVFGKQVKEIEWDKIKTGSKVKIKYSGEHCDGWRWDMDETVEVDVVFFGTKHYLNSNGFNKESHYDHYFTFHAHDDKTNKFVLFGSNYFDNCKNFVVEVVEY